MKILFPFIIKSTRNLQNILNRKLRKIFELAILLKKGNREDGNVRNQKLS